MEVENGETHFFMYAEQHPGNYGQSDLSALWIEKTYTGA